MGRLNPVGLLIVALLSGLPSACATERPDGFYHTVRRGENLYQIGRRFGVATQTLVRVNHIRDVRNVQVGTQLWIPTGRRAGSVSDTRAAPESGRQQARKKLRRSGELSFQWPIRGGKLTSRFGRRRGKTHEGIDLAARPGTAIHAAEAGKVIHSSRLGDYGKVVILKHAGDFRTVYGHASRLLVRRGEFVQRGQKIAEVGSSGNASGPHLHFEVRLRQSPQDPMLYLP